MKRIVFICLLVSVFCLAGIKPIFAEEAATPEEVYEMVIKASQVLLIMGDDALSEFNDPNGEFVWKDTYVFVADCNVPTALAHPFIPALIGPNQAKLQGTRGRYFVADLCKAADDPNGSWTEYWWPRPGYPGQDFRKISFAIGVPGKSYGVSAGIYNESMSVEELNKTLR